MRKRIAAGEAYEVWSEVFTNSVETKDSVFIQIFRSATVCEAPVAALRLVCDTAALQTN